MRIALVCIAKNEDRYIAEWIKYHKALGFDEIFVYQNNWKCTDSEALAESHVHWKEINGEIKQLVAYNDFLKENYGTIDWAAFFDCDEFLVLKDSWNVQTFLDSAKDYYGVAMNWKFFGDSNLTYDTGQKGVLSRFTHCQKLFNQHIKTILNIKKLRDSGMHTKFIENPHNVDIAANGSSSQTIVSSDFKHFVNGPFNKDYVDDMHFLAHFFCKTRSEYINIKIARGRADSDVIVTQELFDASNYNECEELGLLKFYQQNCL